MADADQCEFFFRSFKIITMEQSLLVPELGVNWKKADFRKGEQSQPVEAKMSFCPGGVHREMAQKPSHPCGFHVARPDGPAGK